MQVLARMVQYRLTPPIHPWQILLGMGLFVLLVLLIVAVVLFLVTRPRK